MLFDQLLPPHPRLRPLGPRRGRRAAGVLALISRGPVALLRAVALGLVLLALANPSLVQEEREKVKDIVAVVIDRSTSQTLGDRSPMTEQVRAELQRRFGSLADVEPRYHRGR